MLGGRKCKGNITYLESIQNMRTLRNKYARFLYGKLILTEGNEDELTGETY